MTTTASYLHHSLSGRSPPPEDLAHPSISGSNGGQEAPRRRGSFSFLRRTKSGTQLSASRIASGGKLTKRHRMTAREQEMMREQIPSHAPKIPDIPRPAQLQTFGGGDVRAGSVNHHSPMTNPLPLSSTHNGTAMYRNVPIPPIPQETKRGYVDPYARSESMTNRGRYSYASSAISTINSPRRLRRRKDPTPFNVLIIGAHGSGKTSFLKFLHAALALPARKQQPQLHEDVFDVGNDPSAKSFPSFDSQYLETEIDKERVGLTLWDSPGLEANLVDLQLREMLSFLESKFEDTFNEEMKVVRTPGVRDTHIHCVFLLLDPVRLDSNIAASKKLSTPNGGTNGSSLVGPRSSSLVHALDEDLDLQVLRALQGKTTVIPVIAKADTITSAHMAHLKQAVWDSLKRSNLEKIEALGLDNGDTDSNDGYEFHEQHEDTAIADQERKRYDISQLDSPTDSGSSFSASDFDLAKPPRPAFSSPALAKKVVVKTETPYLPLSIISPDMYEPGVVGRKFPWGFADPFNAEHCDFARLKEMVFTEWRGELREASRDLWYEGWRTSRLDRTISQPSMMGQAI